jgi:hypothetical protein
LKEAEVEDGYASDDDMEEIGDGVASINLQDTAFNSMKGKQSTHSGPGFKTKVSFADCSSTVVSLDAPIGLAYVRDIWKDAKCVNRISL